MPARYALMWSGGKDSALALQRARAAGIDVTRLISFFDAATGRVRFHATRVEMLQAQAASMGIELEAIGTSWPEMESRLSLALRELKKDGFVGVVFGDIHLADVRAWYEERVNAAGLQHVEPLWHDSSIELLEEYVRTGGRAVVTCTDSTKLDESWLGRVIDPSFLGDIAAIGVDACGENGEYHSFAFDGPIFHEPVRWQSGEKRSDGRFIQLDVLRS